MSGIFILATLPEEMMTTLKIPSFLSGRLSADMKGCFGLIGSREGPACAFMMVC
jgi:hypothetical protein